MLLCSSNENDPASVTNARNFEIQMIKNWITAKNDVEPSATYIKIVDASKTIIE